MSSRLCDSFSSSVQAAGWDHSSFLVLSVVFPKVISGLIFFLTYILPYEPILNSLPMFGLKLSHSLRPLFFESWTLPSKHLPPAPPGHCPVGRPLLCSAGAFLRRPDGCVHSLLPDPLCTRFLGAGKKCRLSGVFPAYRPRICFRETLGDTCLC